MKSLSAECFALLPLILTLSGCMSQQEISREELSPHETSISAVVTAGKEVFVFKKDARGHFGMIQDSAVVGTLADGMEVVIPMSRVRRITVLRSDTASTVIVTVGVVAVAGLIALIVVVPRLP